MIINFISSYDHPETNLPVIGLKDIAVNYITGFFFIDLLAVIPFQLLNVDGDTKNFKLTRIARLPRLYRLLRIVRMIKIFKAYKANEQIHGFLDSLNVSSGARRMYKVLVLQFFLIHLMACVWFMSATFEDNLYDTWVGARGIVDNTPTEQYWQAFYWAF